MEDHKVKYMECAGNKCGKPMKTYLECPGWKMKKKIYNKTERP